jgi:hypothetical protein
MGTVHSTGVIISLPGTSDKPAAFIKQNVPSETTLKQPFFRDMFI